MKLRPNPTDDQLEEFNQKNEFVRDASPSEWLSYSEDLRDAAEVLWADSENGMLLDVHTTVNGTSRFEKTTGHARSYILLAGLALENAIKAMLVANDPTLINSGILQKALKSHKLLDLASRISGLSLSKEEQQVLKICEDAIPYWGRYPIPLSFDGLQPKEAATAEFRDGFAKLHSRLCKDVYFAIRDGWDSGVGPKTWLVRSRRYGDEIDLSERLPSEGTSSER
jgi:hypothetical protein